MARQDALGKSHLHRFRQPVPGLRAKKLIKARFGLEAFLDLRRLGAAHDLMSNI